MALNFPSNTDLPYVDPVSGLKYIYNSAVGAWETAIQPPAIVSSTAPALTIPGFLWWDDVSGHLYIYYKDANSEQWVEAVPSGDTVRRAWIGTTPTPAPVPGDMWWDSENGRLYIYYDDGDSSQWIDASPDSAGGDSATSNNRVRIFQSTSTPPNPILNDLWYNSTEQHLYIYNKASEWVRAQRDTVQTGVQSVTASTPLAATSGDNPAISIANASATARGAMRFANQTEADAGVETDAAITPATLKATINNNTASWIPSSSDTQEGLIETATKAEVEAGTSSTTAVTPLSLKEGIPALGVAVPVGTIIMFGGAVPPAGYTVCNGAVLSRSTYATLFAAIGTTHGIGDGVTTFSVPTITGTVLYCIKT